MRRSVLRTCSEEAFGDTVVVSDVAGACFGTYLAQNELESVTTIIIIIVIVMLQARIWRRECWPY